MANFTVSSNNGRSFDHGPVLDNGAFADENTLSDESHAFASILQPGVAVGFEISFELLKRFPGVITPIEQGRMSGLGEVKQISRFEHKKETRPKQGSRANLNWRGPVQIFAVNGA
jgi:hypothetical protein